jgi:hypothetical protein
VAHQPVGVDPGTVEVGERRVDDLAQVVRRNARRRLRRRAEGAVDEQVGKPRREHLRADVDGCRRRRAVLAELTQQLVADRPEPQLGVVRAGGAFAVDRAEEALAVDQRVAHLPVARHPHELAVDRPSPAVDAPAAQHRVHGARAGDVGRRPRLQLRELAQRQAGDRRHAVTNVRGDPSSHRQDTIQRRARRPGQWRTAGPLTRRPPLLTPAGRSSHRFSEAADVARRRSQQAAPGPRLRGFGIGSRGRSSWWGCG